MKKTLTLIALLAVLSMAAVGGQMYEWRDPTTGRLMLGDKPPGDVKYWPEGSRKSGQQSGTSEEELEAMRKKILAAQEERRSLVCNGDRDVKGIKIGMSADEAVFCAGQPPTKINTMKGAAYTHEQWIYRYYILTYETVYLYFDNGVLRTIQK